MNHSILRSGMFCVAAVCLATSVHSASKPKTASNGAVQDVLQSETQVANSSIDRREKICNLVVGDFHTCFVGQSMVLSHDVMTPALTDVKVPGLAAK